MNVHKRSRRQEAIAAAKFGGRVVPGSGSGWAVKNDVRTSRLSIEMKYTDKGSYSLKAAELKKAEKNALLDGGREMAFIVELEGREWVTISREFFIDLLSQSTKVEEI